MALLKDTGHGVSIAIKVMPRASRNEIAGVEGESLKVRLTAPPVEGRANDALVRFLAEKLDLPRTNIEIIRGDTARQKIVRVRGVSLAELGERLGL